MKLESKEILQGIKLHLIKTDKYKTDLSAIIISVPLAKETVTIDCLVPAVLRRGTANITTQEEINKRLEEMYGTTFDCGIEKIGDNHVIKFYMESINDKFLPQKEDILKNQIQLLFEIVFNPYIENGSFKKEYVDSEKENIRQKINAKIDNKAQYALDKCIEAMYDGKPYSLYKFGNANEIDSISIEDLYKRYQDIIQNAKIDIFVSGNFDENQVVSYVEDDLNNFKLQSRIPIFIKNNEETEKKEKVQTKVLEEKLDVLQGKLVLGLDVMENTPGSRYSISIYNVILGESATSKLFQNVREKASLAYTTRSTYTRQKNNIFINSGIEIPNYEKALKIIKEQLEDMKQGNFTEEDILNAKKYMINGINSVEEEQDTEITYYVGQELSGLDISLETYKNEIEKVTREQIIDIANKIQINTIYFLRN